MKTPEITVHDEDVNDLSDEFGISATLGVLSRDAGLGGSCRAALRSVPFFVFHETAVGKAGA